MRAHTKFKKDGVVEEYFFTSPIEVIQAPTSFDTAVNHAKAMQEKGYYAVIGVTYEKDEYFVGIFDAPVSYETFLQGEKPGRFTMTEPRLSESREEIESNIEAVRNYILDGHTYQVNFTTRLYGDFSGDSHQLFLKLTSGNNGDYAMYVDLDGKEILSVSPELFFEIDPNRTIRTKPMKGTAPTFEDQEEDNESYQFLRHSKKDQAENVMIVDLLRNDISRIAKKNTVEATELFTIEKYRTVYQMISVVEAKVRDDVQLSDTFDALFPCGSITGAPKIMTMDIISELEKTPRGYYCGALGILYPDQSMIFNVPIRTMVIEDGNYTYGAGGGITYDSNPSGEFEEILHKTSFLKQGQYALIESMRLEKGNIKRLALHLKRLKTSADYFNYPLDDVQNELQNYIEDKGLHTGVYKLRLTLDHTGVMNISHQEIEPLHIMTACLSTKIMCAPEDFTSHKTTVRHQYNSESNDCDLVLYYNDSLDVTEFNIGNLVVEENGVLTTPVLRPELLNGVMRQSLLTEGVLIERDYSVETLKKKYQSNEVKLYMINSVREWVAVTLEG